jgi:hypothetical protein
VQGANVQYADDSAAVQKRDADQRSDALLHENRVQDVGVIDVAQDDRPLLGGDPSGEAAAQRDPHVLADLFLDAAGRGGDELA